MKRLYIRQITVSIPLVCLAESSDEADEIALANWRDEATSEVPMIQPLSVVPEEWMPIQPCQKVELVSDPTVGQLLEWGVEVAPVEIFE